MIEVAKIYTLNADKSYLKGFADVIVNGQVLIKGVKIAETRDKKLFVALPKQYSKSGKWYDLVVLLDNKIKEELQEAVLKAYRKGSTKKQKS